jgi:hypothetical protein
MNEEHPGCEETAKEDWVSNTSKLLRLSIFPYHHQPKSLPAFIGRLRVTSDL